MQLGTLLGGLKTAITLGCSKLVRLSSSKNVLLMNTHTLSGNLCSGVSSYIKKELEL